MRMRRQRTVSVGDGVVLGGHEPLPLLGDPLVPRGDVTTEPLAEARVDGKRRVGTFPPSGWNGEGSGYGHLSEDQEVVVIPTTPNTGGSGCRPPTTSREWLAGPGFLLPPSNCYRCLLPPLLWLAQAGCRTPKRDHPHGGPRGAPP